MTRRLHGLKRRRLKQRRLKQRLGRAAAAIAALMAVGHGLPAQADAVIDRLYQDAKTEGKVSLQAAPNTVLRDAMTAAFTKRFPDIQFEYTGMAGRAATAKIVSEDRAGVYSVDVIISGTTTGLKSLKPRGLLRPLDAEIVSPEARDPSKWMGGGLAWADKDKTTLAMTIVILTPLIINTDMVKPGEIEGDKDLLNPKWKGKIASNNPGVSGAANVLYRYFYDAHGPQFIKDLKAQDVVVTNDLRQIVDWVANGRYPIGLGASGQSIAQFLGKGVTNLGVEDGAKWRDGLVETPGFGGVFMTKTVPHPKAARLLVNWLLTQEGQTALVAGLRYSSRRLDVSQDPVPGFLRPLKGRKYIEGWNDEFLDHPNQDKLVELLKEIRFGEQ